VRGGEPRWDFPIAADNKFTKTYPQQKKVNTMNPRTTILTLAFAIASATFATTGTVEAGQVKGTDVKMVLYGQGSAASGTFVQTGNGTWIEHNQDGRFDFQEEGRDEWSVYLVKVGRQAGQRVQLDLHRKTVSTGDYIFYSILRSFE